MLLGGPTQFVSLDFVHTEWLHLLQLPGKVLLNGAHPHIPHLHVAHLLLRFSWNISQFDVVTKSFHDVDEGAIDKTVLFVNDPVDILTRCATTAFAINNKKKQNSTHRVFTSISISFKTAIEKSSFVFVR